MKLNISLGYANKINRWFITDIQGCDLLPSYDKYNWLYQLEFEKHTKNLLLNLNRMYKTESLRLQEITDLINNLWCKIWNLWEECDPDNLSDITYWKYRETDDDEKKKQLAFDVNHLELGLDTLISDIIGFLQIPKPFKNDYSSLKKYSVIPSIWFENKKFKELYSWVVMYYNLLSMESIHNDIYKLYYDRVLYVTESIWYALEGS